MRAVSLVYLMILSTSLYACETPIRMLYGPYVTLLMVQKLLTPMHNRVEKASGCEVEYTLASSFEDLANKLVELEHDFALVPASYSAITLEMGYERFVSISEENRYIYIVAHAQSNIHSLNDLTGKELLSISPLSESGASFEQLLREKQLRSRVKVVNGNNYEQNIFKVLSGQSDSAIAISIYWDQLDDYMKSKKLKVVSKLKSRPAEFVKRFGRDHIAQPVRNVLLTETALTWELPDHELQYNQELKEAISAYINSGMN